MEDNKKRRGAEVRPSSSSGGENPTVHRGKKRTRSDDTASNHSCSSANSGKREAAPMNANQPEVLSYICLFPGCEKEYKEHAALTRHVKNAHRRVKVHYKMEKIACEGCGAVFKNVWKKNAHQVKCSSCPQQKGKKYACIECCRYFWDEATYKNHVCDFYA